MQRVLKRRREDRGSEEECEEEECAYDDVPSHYWNRRRSLFSRFDDGIQLDKSLFSMVMNLVCVSFRLCDGIVACLSVLGMWYSVTPEKIAIHHAERFKGKTIVLDAFAGAGGNAIQFALRKDISFVLGVECVFSRARQCRNNARVYSAHKRLDVICADSLTLVRSLRPVVDAVFLSPPWGGPKYKTFNPFPLDSMNPDGFEVFRASSALTLSLAYYIPLHTDVKHVYKLLEMTETKNKTCEIEFNHVDGRPLTVTLYFGDLVQVHDR